jgi:hypothetical protein
MAKRATKTARRARRSTKRSAPRSASGIALQVAKFIVASSKPPVVNDDGGNRRFLPVAPTVESGVLTVTLTGDGPVGKSFLADAVVRAAPLLGFEVLEHRADHVRPLFSEYGNGNTIKLRRRLMPLLPTAKEDPLGEPLGSFLAAHVRCVAGGAVTARTMFDAYIAWHRGRGYGDGTSEIKFARQMRECGFHMVRGRQNFWRNVSLVRVR